MELQQNSFKPIPKVQSWRFSILLYWTCDVICRFLCSTPRKSVFFKQIIRKCRDCGNFLPFLAGFIHFGPFTKMQIFILGILSSNYRHSINMFTAFLKNCEILNEARQKKIVWIPNFDSKWTVRKYSNKDCHKNTVSRTFSCLKVKCSLYGFHRVVHWSPSCSIVDLWYLCKRASITYQLSKVKELESELIFGSYGITQYVMRCVPKRPLSGLKRYTCPEIRTENE